jgi:YD repeat-containing protein
MMRKNRLVVFAIVTLLVASTAIAQKPAPVELGFKADGLYQFSGLDSVNLFNGNLIARIPIGSTYHVNGGFKYGFTLFYNSKVWDYDQTPDPAGSDQTATTAYPNWSSNAGVGWRLSLGRLIGTTKAQTNSSRWIYEGPAGDEHVFVPSYENNPPASNLLYSVDQDRMRLVTGATLSQVEFSSGEIHTFEKMCGAWHLTKMADRHGNFLKITPTCDANDRVIRWDLTDSLGRSHSVTFKHYPATRNSTDRGQHVEFIVLGTVAGPLTYQFKYDDDAEVDWGCGHEPLPTMGFPARASLPLLTSIVLPDESSFGFGYWRLKTEGGGFCSQGTMRSLKVPTGGTFDYTYQQMQLPEEFCRVPQFPLRNPGIRTRNTPDGRWDYLTSLGKAIEVSDAERRFCEGIRPRDPGQIPPPEVEQIRRWARMSVLSPAVVTDATSARTRVRTDNFFYVWPDRATVPLPSTIIDQWNPTNPDGSPIVKYGQAITTGAPAAASLGPVGNAVDDVDIREGVTASIDPARLHYLSTRVYGGCPSETTVTGTCQGGALLRSNYLRFGPPEYADGTARWTYPAESTRVLYNDDQACGAASNELCWIQTSASGRDDFGKYEKSTSTNNFSGVATAFETETNYLGPGPEGEWLLNLYDRTSRTEGGLTAVTQYSFNRTNGFLDAVRTRVSAAALMTDDVLTVFSGTRGNVEWEESYGGDGGNLSTENPFSTAGALRHYVTRNTFENGALKKAEACARESAAGTCTSLVKHVDIDVHASGVPTASRDVSGIQTSYEYDGYGRLKTVTAPGPSLTTYTYTTATSSSNAKVRETVTTAEGIRLAETLYEFDGVGRIVNVTRALPEGKSATVSTTYDALGRKIKVTQPHAPGEGTFPSETIYDSLGRPISLRTPDGKTTTFRHGGERWMERTVSVATSETGEAPVTVKEYYDAQRRLTKVEEYSGDTSMEKPIGTLTATTYRYDVGGRLVEARIGTQAARKFTYDLRGFLTDEDHPESGITSYRLFDSRGHAREKTDGNGTLKLAYDGAERLTEVLRPDGTVLKKFDFATANEPESNKQAGKLTSTMRRNDSSAGAIEVSETFLYEHPTGQLSRRTTVVEKVVSGSATRYPIQTFVQDLEEYDALGLPKKIGMPTCSLNGCSTSLGLGDLTFERDTGYLKNIHGFASLTYASSGMVRSVGHQLATTGGTETDQYEPDSGMARPKSIRLAGSTCPIPVPVIQSSGSICSGKPGTASVAPIAGATYHWTIAGGVFTSPTNAATISYQAGTGSITLGVRVTTACGEGSHSKAIAASTALEQPVLTAPQAVCANSAVTASAPVNPDVTYTWGISPGSWTGTGPSVSFPAPSTPFTLTVTANNSCGGSASTSKQIDVAPSASAKLYLTNPNILTPEVYRVRGSGESIVLKVEFPEISGPWEIVWSDGVRETATQNPHQRSVSPDKYTLYQLTSVSPQRCGEPIGTVTVKVRPPAPASVVATTQPDGKVFISWTSVPGAASYSIERGDKRTFTVTGPQTVIAETAGDVTSLLYTPAAGPAAVNFYYVRAVDPGHQAGYTGEKSEASAFDHAITGIVPVAGLAIDGTDIQRLRTGVDAYRVAFGIPMAYTTPPANPSEAFITASEITDLVNRLNAARPLNDPFSYRDVPPPVSQGYFYRAHLEQLWEALR